MRDRKGEMVMRDRKGAMVCLVQHDVAIRGCRWDSSPGSMAPEFTNGQMCCGLKEILCIRLSAESLAHSECSARTATIIIAVPHSSPWPLSWVQPWSYRIGLTILSASRHMLDDETCLIIKLFFIFSLGVDATSLAAERKCARRWSFYSWHQSCILKMTFFFFWHTSSCSLQKLVFSGSRKPSSNH